MYAGDADEGERLLQPLRELGDLVTDFSGQMSYCEIQQLFDTLIPFGQYRCYWKSHYLSGLGRAAIDMILEGNAAPPSPNTLSSIWNFGGATARVAATDTAFGDRSMPYMLSIDSVWEAPADDAANIAWTRDFWERMKPHSDRGRIYLNFPGLGEEGEELVRRSFGANFAGSRRSSGNTTRTTSSASTRTSDRLTGSRAPGWESQARMSIVTRVLDLARGTDAFHARDWSRARDLLRDALSAGTSDEALEMLAVSSWWLDDGPTARLARERQFRSAPGGR